MINLIPNEEKKKMSKDFYFRLTSVFFMMIGVSIFVGSVTIFPSYFVSFVKNNYNKFNKDNLRYYCKVMNLRNNENERKNKNKH